MTILELEKIFDIGAEEKEKSSLHVGSLSDEGDVQKAIDIITNGGIIASQMRGVFGIWVNARDFDSVKAAHNAKGSSVSKPLSLMLPIDKFLHLVDLDSVHPDLVHLFQSATEYQSRMGAICHARLPIKEEEVKNLPYTVVSEDGGKHFVHNLDPTGHESMSKLIRRMIESGVDVIGVTSLGDTSSGGGKDNKEITTIYEAIKFCQRDTNNIDILLLDHEQPNEVAVGSFAILDFSKAKALRDGHISVGVIKKILGVDIDTNGMKDHGFVQIGTEVFRDESEIDDLRTRVINFFRN